ncbi:MAG: hypothetical protein K8R57_02945 [Verrucomicrobia bacterium]|nr:hypothetical protein [Verrucomicrobiota bacterium]
MTTKTKTPKKLEFQPFTCCICERDIKGQMGNNPDPLNTMPEATCCEQCNDFVEEARDHQGALIAAAKAVVEILKPKSKRTYEPTKRDIARGSMIVNEGLAFRAWVQEAVKNHELKKSKTAIHNGKKSIPAFLIGQSDRQARPCSRSLLAEGEGFSLTKATTLCRSNPIQRP